MLSSLQSCTAVSDLVPSCDVPAVPFGDKLGVLVCLDTLLSVLAVPKKNRAIYKLMVLEDSSPVWWWWLFLHSDIALHGVGFICGFVLQPR